MNPKGQSEVKRERIVKALELKTAGASYRQIGRQLGVSEKCAYYDVQAGLRSLDAVTKVHAERHRDLEIVRLERLLLALAQGIAAGSPPAVLAAVRIGERRAKLLGLDAPTKTELTGGEGAPFAFTITVENPQAAKGTG